MYTLTIQNKKTKKVTRLQYTSVDMPGLELQLNIMRNAFDLPEFTELMDSTFAAENKGFLLILEESEPQTTLLQ